MIFQPDVYYVGDLGFVLPNDDLRSLFAGISSGGLKSGFRDVLTSLKIIEDEYVYDTYWLFATPHKAGTFYDQDGKGWGFDWGCFGVIRWKWIQNQGSYHPNKVEFAEPFTCSHTDDSVTIGHLHFTFNPK